MEKVNPVTGEVYGTLKPNVDSVFSNGWNQTWKNFFELLLAQIIVFAASTPMFISGFVSSRVYYYEGPGLGFFLFFYGILILAPMKYGMSYIYLQAARKESCDASGFGEAFKNYLNVILASLLVSIITVAGFIFLFIPGIIFVCKLAFVPYLVVERRLDAIEAIQKSWEMTRGYALDIFLIYFLYIPIQIAGFLALIVGTIPATMWCEVSMASMYVAVEAKSLAERESADPTPVTLS
ncbi:MAG TPA: hypothetical protein VLA34_09025 [Candidatus Krumholzibacterium sp.]|nr:hypothetical protein [Candidatus Krumholzibacterium sp.]